MKAFLANPLVSRIAGAIGAGATTYLVSHDWKTAATTAATFIIYGGVHATASSTGN